MMLFKYFLGYAALITGMLLMFYLFVYYYGEAAWYLFDYLTQISQVGNA